MDQDNEVYFDETQKEKRRNAREKSKKILDVDYKRPKGQKKNTKKFVYHPDMDYDDYDYLDEDK